jgi:hypothetical protein
MPIFTLGIIAEGQKVKTAAARNTLARILTKHQVTYLLLLISQIYFGQTWQWIKTGDGTGYDHGVGICCDTSGNIFTTGSFNSPTLTFGTSSVVSTGTYNVFLTKHDPNGNVLWIRSSNGYGQGSSVSCDNVGNVYLTGSFNSPTISFGTFTLTNNTGNFSAFLVKYDPNGTVLWAQRAIGLSVSSSVNSDINGNSYIAGYFTGTNVVFGSNTVTSTGYSSIFIAKYDPNGNALWAQTASGPEYAGAASTKVDSYGNVYVVGNFSTPKIVFGTYTLNTVGTRDIFITKYDATGNVIWASSSKGVYTDAASCVSTDILGNAYMTGFFYSPSIVFGSYTLTNSGIGDAFIVKYNSNGIVAWAKNPTCSGNEIGYAISTDVSGNSVVSGWFNVSSISFDFITVPLPPGPPEKMFVAKYDFNGNAMYATAIANDNGDRYDLATDKYCNTYVVNDFIGTGNPSTITIGSNTITNSGSQNIFIAKLSFPTNCQPIPVLTSENSKLENSVVISPNPNDGSFKIRTEKPIQNGLFVLYGSFGQLIFRREFGESDNDIKIDNLPSGLYYYSLLENHQKINSGRLVIE